MNPIGECLYRFRIKRRRRILAGRIAIGVVRIRRESEAHRAGVSLSPPAVKAREPRRPPERQHQNAGRERIERAQMADLPKSDEPAHGLDHVVRGFPARLVDDKNSVNGRRFWGSWHFVS